MNDFIDYFRLISYWIRLLLGRNYFIYNKLKLSSKDVR
jgi:hypothetical protein